MNDEFYLRLAINAAWQDQFLTYPNPAVGCAVLDRHGALLALATHKRAGGPHAELAALGQALCRLRPGLETSLRALAGPAELYDFLLHHHGGLFAGGTIYVSLEPCAHQGRTPPCAKLLCQLGLARLVFSATDEGEDSGGGAELLRAEGVKVLGGLLAEEGQALLRPFKKWQKDRLWLFKLALSKNGSALGRIVSGQASRTYAHKIRSIIDLLVVGGQTVRTDRPILDARLAVDETGGAAGEELNGEGVSGGARAPDLCILSRQKLEDFDRSIPLFSVPGRRIYSQIPSSARFVMFEGGEEFLRAFAGEMDLFLIFSNSTFNQAPSIQVSLPLRPLYLGRLGDDSYGIYERIGVGQLG